MLAGLPARPRAGVWSSATRIRSGSDPDEAADERLELGPVASGDVLADDDVLTARVAVEQDGARGDQDHSRRRGLTLAEAAHLRGEVRPGARCDGRRRRTSGGPGTAGRWAAPVRPGHRPGSAASARTSSAIRSSSTAPLPGGEVAELDLQWRSRPGRRRRGAANSCTRIATETASAATWSAVIKTTWVRRPCGTGSCAGAAAVAGSKGVSISACQRSQHLGPLLLGRRWDRSMTGTGTGVAGCTTCAGVPSD